MELLGNNPMKTDLLTQLMRRGGLESKIKHKPLEVVSFHPSVCSITNYNLKNSEFRLGIH